MLRVIGTTPRRSRIDHSMIPRIAGVQPPKYSLREVAGRVHFERSMRMVNWHLRETSVIDNPKVAVVSRPRVAWNGRDNAGDRSRIRVLAAIKHAIDVDLGH